MEHFFLNMGLSWTASKIIPYVLFIVLGLIIYLFLRKRFKSKLRKRLLMLLIPIPVVSYFAFSPIYQGDFSNNYRSEVIDLDSLNLAQNTLSVIAIPDCPYCSESIKQLNEIIERVPNGTIEFVLLTSDEKRLKPYRELADKRIVVRTETAFDRFEKLAGYEYPAFVFSKKGTKTAQIWNNNTFGVMAMDMIESELSNL